MAFTDVDLLVANFAIDFAVEVVTAGRSICLFVSAEVLSAASRPSDSPAVSSSFVCVREVGVEIELEVEVIGDILDYAVVVEHLPTLGAK